MFPVKCFSCKAVVGMSMIPTTAELVVCRVCVGFCYTLLWKLDYVHSHNGFLLLLSDILNTFDHKLLEIYGSKPKGGKEIKNLNGSNGELSLDNLLNVL